MTYHKEISGEIEYRIHSTQRYNFNGLEIWLDGQERALLSQRTRVRFPTFSMDGSRLPIIPVIGDPMHFGYLHTSGSYTYTRANIY